MKKWIYIVGLVFCGHKLVSQNTCDNIIEEASDLYNTGRYEECIQILENGIKTCSLSKSKKENAYVLLINSNIEKDSLPGVDKNFRLLLKNNPSFKIKDYTGSDDFTKKFDNYYVFPKLSFGIRPHYSIPKIWSTGSYQSDLTPNIKNNTEFKTKRIFNINTNLILEYRAIEKISFFADAGFFSISYSRELELKDSLWKMTSAEESKYFQLGFGNKFYFLKSQKKFNFYLMGGFNNQYLRKSVLNIVQEKKQITNLYGDLDTKVESFEREFVSDKLRNSYVVSVLLGTGITYRIGNFGLGLDVRTSLSANTLNNKTARFKEPALIQKYNYIDTDKRLQKSDFSLVFTYLLYKVKKSQLKIDF